MLVQQLRPWVTSFSADIQTNYPSGDEVCVGGKIVSIFDMGASLEDMAEGVYLTLDDGVGEIEVGIPRQVYDRYKDEADLSIGSILLATGRLYRMPMTRKGKEQKNHPEETTRVLSWKFGNLPKEEVK